MMKKSMHLIPITSQLNHWEIYQQWNSPILLTVITSDIYSVQAKE